VTNRELTTWWAFLGLGIAAVLTGNKWFAVGAAAEAALGLSMSLRARRRAQRERQR
jgi:hypothetical protein